MKNPVKKLVCLLFAFVFVLHLAPAPAVTAPGSLIMLSVNDDLMPPEEGTVPFWENGTLYIPHTAFKGIYRESIGVSYASTVDGGSVFLFDQSTALTFDLENGTVLDNKQMPYAGAAVKRNGTVFFPVDLVADFFGLSYTYNQTDVAPLLRIKNGNVSLGDARFIDAAKNLMRHYYKEYEKTTDKTVDNQPSVPETVTDQWVYPVFTVTDIAATGQILDVLDRWNVQATFLMTAEQMEQNADLLRRMVGTRQAVAIVPGDTVTEDLSRGSEALWAAARATTRFVWLGKDGEKTALPPAFCALRCRLDSSARPLTSASRADALYERISALSAQHVTLFLGDDADNTTALRHFLSKLDAGDCRTLSWRETL